MKIVVFGAGAIGSLFGALLSRENEVTLVGREEHVLAIRENGLQIRGMTEMVARPKAVASARDCELPDVLFLTVKSYDTESAMEEAKGLVGEGTLVVSIQNGLGNLEAISKALGDTKIIGGVTSHGAILTAPGIVEHTGISDTYIGAFRGSDENDAGMISGLLGKAGIQTTLSKDILLDIWYKVLVNSAINPLAALSNETNGLIVRDEKMKEKAREIVSEGVRVARSHGVTLDEDEAFSRVILVSTQTAGNRNSMLRDVEQGKETEIDSMNGALVRLGNEMNIETPVNRKLVGKIKALRQA